MSEEKTENKFLRFFQRNRKIFLPFKYFIYLVGIVVIIFFILDFASLILLKSKETMQIDEELGWFYYHPYIDFTAPLSVTENPCKDMSEDPLLIYTFGGSTMTPIDVRENETIASYISGLLCEEGFSVEVKNFGVPAHISTQSVIKLFLELRDNNIPDIVIFYDGHNDIASGGSRGYSIRTPQAFNYFLQKESVFSNLKEYLSRNFTGTNLASYSKNDIPHDYFSKFQLDTDGLFEKDLHKTVMENYLNNVRIVRSIGEGWGFKSFFYWQPHLYHKIDNLSYEEKIQSYKYWPDIMYFERADPIVTKFLSNNRHVRDLRNIFGNYKDTIFIDNCHILAEGNKIIAEKMVEDIVKYLEESNYYEKK